MKIKILCATALFTLLASAGAGAGGSVVQVAPLEGQTSNDCTQVPLPFFDPRPLVEGGTATLIRTKNGVSGFVTMPTPGSGTYCYPPMTISGDAETGPAVPGHPEAFTLWIIYFNQPENCASVDGTQCNVPDVLGPNCENVHAGAMKLGGHVVGGDELQLSGHASAGDGPLGALGCAPLYDIEGAEIHLAVAPHGMLLPRAMPRLIQTPPGGGPGYWYPATFAPID